MKFLVEPTSNLDVPELQLHSDNSFSTKDNVYWDFQISIENTLLLLMNFNYELKKFVGFEGIKPVKFKEVEILINSATKAKLTVDKFDVTKDSYGIAYKLETNKVFYDNKSKTYAIGDLKSKCANYEIGDGQYIKLDDNGQLKTIYFRL